MRLFYLSFLYYLGSSCLGRWEGVYGFKGLDFIEDLDVDVF